MLFHLSNIRYCFPVDLYLSFETQGLAFASAARSQAPKPCIPGTPVLAFGADQISLEGSRRKLEASRKKT